MGGPSQKNLLLGTPKMENGSFAKKMKALFENIVFHFKMHTYAKYEIIWTNFAMNFDITLGICLIRETKRKRKTT